MFGAFVNLILNFALSPRMGIAGAALASLFAQLCAAFLFDLAYPQTRKMFLTKVKAIFLLPESS